MARCLNNGVDFYLDIASERAAAFELHPSPETRAQAQSATPTSSARHNAVECS
jgi:hypothetical protein